MPIYPGDRVPENIQRERAEQQRTRERLQAAGAHICELLLTHHDRIMATRERVNLLVAIRNGEYSPLGNANYDQYERDAWIVWSRRYIDAAFANMDSLPEPIERSEHLLVTPQKQFCATSFLAVSIRESKLSDLNSDIGVRRMSEFIGRCAQKQSAIHEQDIDSVTAEIAAVLS